MEEGYLLDSAVLAWRWSLSIRSNPGRSRILWCTLPWAALRDPTNRNTEGPFLVRATTVGQMTERRRRDRFIAWGVSPRYRVSEHQEAPERGRQIAAASASATIFRVSVAASRLEDLLCAVFLGLTPQAMDMPPLRGWFEPSRRNAGSFSRPGKMSARNSVSDL